MTKSTYFNELEYQIATRLRTMTCIEAAEDLGISVSYLYNRLEAMRKKTEKSHNTVNVASNWKDSKKNPRLAKLLRRAKNVED